MDEPRQAEAPGPRGAPLIGSLREFQRSALELFLAGWRKYGDVVRFRVGPQKIYFLAHPDQLKEILEERHLEYPHPEWFDARFRSAVGHGIVTHEGEEWLRHRRLLEPVYAHDRMAALERWIVESIDETLAAWDPRARSGEAFNIRPDLNGLSATLLGRCFFGDDWQAEAGPLSRGVDAFIAQLDRKLQAPVNLPAAVPTPANRRFLAARREYDAAFYRILARRRSGVSGDDLLARFLEAGYGGDGAEPSDAALRDHVTNHYVAGHGTGGAAFMWTCYLLGSHPEVSERLERETRTMLAGRTPAISDLAKLEYARMVVRESMRVYPPLWLGARSPLRDDDLGGYRVPAGTFINFSSFVTHRHPEFWDEPERFDPDRFAPDRSASQHPFAWLPLSQGPRDCIGGALALVELELFTAMLAQRYRVRAIPDQEIEFELGTGLSSRHGIRVTLEPAG